MEDVQHNAHKKYGISAAVLKWIAVATMVIDHYAVAVYWKMPGSS